MTNKSTKRALISSILVLCLCFTTLLGTTFAWFTDSATSSGNVIKTGTLNVELYENTAAGLTEITDSTDPVFGDNIWWEPNATHVKYFTIKNAGSLALKFRVGLKVYDVEKNLNEVMQYNIVENATPASPVTAWTTGTDVTLGTTNTTLNDISLEPGSSYNFGLAIHMDKEAGNEYQAGTIKFDINVLATQYSSELDSFGKTYDELAVYTGSGAGKLNNDQVAAEVHVYGEDKANKVAAFVVPKEAMADPTAVITAIVEESDYNGNFTITAGYETIVYNVTMEGLKDGNTTPIKSSLRIPAGKDPATVSLYHYDELILSTYNPETGLVTFETTDYSPFTIVFDNDSVYVPATPSEDGKPTASVTAKVDYVGVSLPWGSYGQWSPDKNVDADPKLEAAYVFACTETVAQAKENKYANWYCDFYVSLDRDLGANQIFLGGNYGSFGWVGFHNGDVTLAANTELPLLGSVTSNPWTYLDVVQNVGTFTCGVGDVNDALKGATFTVMLRLTNPENENDFFNVATIKYTFQ